MLGLRDLRIEIWTSFFGTPFVSLFAKTGVPQDAVQQVAGGDRKFTRKEWGLLQQGQFPAISQEQCDVFEWAFVEVEKDEK